MANLELVELTKHYKQGKTVVRALDGVSLRIDSGEFVSVVGRSGSGKTTLLDLVGLLLRPTSGTVRIDGVDTATMKDGQRADMRGQRIGFIFQEYNLLPGLNVVENVMLPLRYTRSNVGDGRKRALDLLELVELTDRISHRPDELSGGQQQRVAIARSLAMQPEVLLLDEPTSALDPEMRGEVLAVLRDLAGTCTMLVVTHEMAFARGVASRIWVFDEGRLVEDGPPAQVCDHPRSERARAFFKAAG